MSIVLPNPDPSKTVGDLRRDAEVVILRAIAALGAVGDKADSDDLLALCKALAAVRT